ncbi:hypothetical protein ATCV1_z043L [Acanthocystis turfacea chlorella virus 1]|uniref:Uncharacterized protein z043L n=1 Tax=Chlorovirus heliozoae TaxID=322019 RepID=A7K803_9PHYC|nr:hypothetical protein ATCV1_z043L [Acanthocystis turfacea chlorella virus 1]ABT16177.1 hypothetical protein ATCV1_z043L [Acanthocystis turfacea chlorella virus 1]
MLTGAIFLWFISTRNIIPFSAYPHRACTSPLPTGTPVFSIPSIISNECRTCDGTTEFPISFRRRLFTRVFSTSCVHGCSEDQSNFGAYVFGIEMPRSRLNARQNHRCLWCGAPMQTSFE